MITSGFNFPPEGEKKSIFNDYFVFQETKAFKDATPHFKHKMLGDFAMSLLAKAKTYKK